MKLEHPRFAALMLQPMACEPVESQAQFTLVIAGIFHEPSMIEGGVSFGQYKRSIGMKRPWAGKTVRFLFGAGVLSLQVQIDRAVGVLFQLVALERVTVQRIGDEEILRVVHRKRPEAINLASRPC